MWPDNESLTDLLGFDVFADEICEALTQPTLYPLTIGIFGDWGSGKSSLLRIARSQLEAAEGDRYICVDFTPWANEDYEDIKAALMSAILDELEHRTEIDAAELSRLRAFLRRMRSMARPMAVGGAAILPAAAALAAGDLASPLLDPEVSSLVGQAAGSAVAAAVPPKGPGQSTSPDIETISEFRSTYKRLLEGVDGVDGVVVFVDDLDRCLPESIIDTFEAIRLFLDTPKCAFVVAANRHVVQESINFRYRGFGGGTGSIGHDYLEKMIQMQVVVPVLSHHETASYTNLLLSSLHLDADTHRRLCDAYRAHRNTDPFGAGLTAPLINELLGQDLREEFAKDLLWATDVVDCLSVGLRGNPRQIKRFLNDVRLRQGAARRREVVLETPVLSKLMILEETDLPALQQLLDWQLKANGPIPQLEEAEKRASSARGKPSTETKTSGSSSPTKKPAPKKDAVQQEDPTAAWLARPAVARWMKVGEPLGTTDLRRYFTYFRSSLSVNSAAARLGGKPLTIYLGLRSDAPALARQAASDAAELTPGELDSLLRTLESEIMVDPKTPSLIGACELAARVPAAVEEVCRIVLAIPHNRVPQLSAVRILTRLPESAGRETIVKAWSASPQSYLVQAAQMSSRSQGS